MCNTFPELLSWDTAGSRPICVQHFHYPCKIVTIERQCGIIFIIVDINRIVHNELLMMQCYKKNP